MTSFFRLIFALFASMGLILCLPWAMAQPPSESYTPAQHQDVPLSPRTSLGRKNLQYEFDLNPANVFRHLEVVEKHEKKFKLKRRINLFRDNTIFEDDI